MRSLRVYEASGIHLYTSFICEECEREMIGTDTRDIKYKYYLKQLKKLRIQKFFHNNIESESQGEYYPLAFLHIGKIYYSGLY